MSTNAHVHQPAEHGTGAWLRYTLIVLALEKCVQHVVVSLAFFFNWKDISSTVVVSPAALLVLGAVAAGLFMVTLWGLVKRRRWAADLAIGLALFDIVGEFVAQGTLGIALTVSFLVAALLLVLALAYRRQIGHTVTQPQTVVR